MAKQKSDIVHVALSTKALDADEKSRDELVGTLLKMGPNSSLAAGNPAIVSAITNVGKTYTAYKTAAQVAAASGQQHASDLAAAGDAQVLSNKSIRLLANLVENDATTVKQVTDVGYVGYTGRPTPPPLAVPVVNIHYGTKNSGKATPTVQDTGRHAYVAEVSPNPITTWSTLVGGGKTRKLTGAPGTSVWVRFAMRRGQLQGDWSTPVLVVFP